MLGLGQAGPNPHPGSPHVSWACSSLKLSFLICNAPHPQGCPEACRLIGTVVWTTGTRDQAAGRPIWRPRLTCSARPDTGWTDRPSGQSHEPRPLPLLRDLPQTLPACGLSFPTL